MSETPSHSSFDYDSLPEGFYHEVIETGHPVRRAWHLQKFERVIDCLPKGRGLSLLDVGCFAGTFLSLIPRERFARQLGVDIVAKQVAYANRRFAADFREFRAIGSLDDIEGIAERFDCITLIEVIEHLNEAEVSRMLHALIGRLKPGGRLIMSTPNYASTWPALEILLNRISDVSYEEQHLTKFNFFTAEKKLRAIYPALDRELRLLFKTTTHFGSPFLAALSLPLAARVSRMFPHERWSFPFGNLILLQFEKR